MACGSEGKQYRSRSVVLFAGILALAGCAAIRRNEAISTEQLLVAAGFQTRPADTPERLTDLNSMPRQKLVVRSKDGNVVYTYADPDKCHCFYVGGPKEYSTYERLRVEKEIARDNAKAPKDWPGEENPLWR